MSDMPDTGDLRESLLTSGPSSMPDDKAQRRDALYFAIFVSVAAFTVVALCVTFGVWLLATDAPDPRFMLAALCLDAALLFILLCFAIRRWREHLAVRQGKRAEAYTGSGMRLKTRITIAFSIVTIVPAASMAVFSMLLFNAGVRAWFDTKVSSAISNSVAVAEAYLKEHKNIIAADILGIANDLNRHAYMIRRNPRALDRQLTVLAGVRKLPEALIFVQSEGMQRHIVARSHLTIALEFFMDKLTPEVMLRADNGEAVILAQENEDRVTAVIRVENLPDSYLFVGRPIDRDILNYVSRTQGAALEYQRMEADITRLYTQFFVIFLFLAGGLLVAVVSYGVYFGASIARPLNELSGGARAIAEGDYGVHVAPRGSYREILTLTETFNRMSGTLEKQKHALISAQRHKAWSDIARRIAHEIKNPLTPIQLSAERLKKRFARGIPAADASADRYINTVLRNVTQIRNIIEEFTVFAKIKPPVLEVRDCAPLVREAMTSIEIIFKDISFNIYTHGSDRFIISCDQGKFLQIMVNILKNAGEALDEYVSNSGKKRVEVHIFTIEQACAIVVADNGPGFPEHILSSVTEPYVTTKKKGTGLGLAIVKKLVEDHGGDISFSNKEGGGAETTLVFPLQYPVKQV